MSTQIDESKINRCGVVFIKEDPSREEKDFEKSQILFIKHPLLKGKSVNIWDIPKGHVEKGETPEECAKRELYEETGIIINDFNDFEKIRIKKTLIYLKKVNCINEYNHFNTQDIKEVEEVKWLTLEETNNITYNSLVKSILKILRNPDIIN